MIFSTFPAIAALAGLALAAFGLYGLAKTPATIKRDRELASLEAAALRNHQGIESHGERAYRLMCVADAEYAARHGGLGNWLAAAIFRGLPALLGIGLVAWGVLALIG